MEQPESNPRFCTKNCGFYGSSQFEGMCSKCYRDHANGSYNAGQADSYPSYYSSSNLLPNEIPTPANDQDEMTTTDNEEMMLLPNTEIPESSEPQTVEEPMETSTSSSTLPHVASEPVLSTTTSNSIEIPKPTVATAASSIAETPVESSSLDISSSSVEKKKPLRCSWTTCSKKLGLTGFHCRCGGQFCPLHRYANEHNCTFDYKELGQNEIRKNMPVVQAERVRRI